MYSCCLSVIFPAVPAVDKKTFSVSAVEGMWKFIFCVALCFQINFKQSSDGIAFFLASSRRFRCCFNTLTSRNVPAQEMLQVWTHEV